MKVSDKEQTKKQEKDKEAPEQGAQPLADEKAEEVVGGYVTRAAAAHYRASQGIRHPGTWSGGSDG